MPIEYNSATSQPRTPQEERADKARRTTQRNLLWGGGALLILSFVGLLRLLVFEMTVITSGSMEPALQRGDYALVDRRVVLRHSWQRGDIVLFNTPEEWEDDLVVLVKRVVAVPGETIRIIDGRVFINGTLLDEPWVAQRPLRESMPATRLAPRQYFVIGDNRNNSFDSRDAGPIDEHSIKGRVVQILLPRARAGSLYVNDDPK